MSEGAAALTQQLRWQHDRGMLHCDGVTVMLREPPHVPGLAPYEAITFVPEHERRSVRPVDAPWRELNDAECLVVEEWLSRVSASMHRALSSTWGVAAERRNGERRRQ